MSASRPKTFRLSHPLVEALELRSAHLGYRSATELIEALCRYDCATQSAHGVTTTWAKLTPQEQDELDERLLERVKAKRGMKATEVAKIDWRDL